VITTSLLRGIVRSTDFRLWVRAPWIVISSGSPRAARLAIVSKSRASRGSEALARRTAGGRAGSRPQPPNEPLRSMWVCLRSTSIHLTYSVSVFCWKRRLRSWGWASSKGHGLERAAIDELEQVATEGHLDGGRHLPGREALDRAVHPRCELRVVDPAEVALALGIHLRGASRDFLEFDAGLDLRPGGGDAGAGLGARGRRPAAVADDDVAEVDLFAAGRLLREALVVERLQLVLGHFDPGAHHRVHDLAAFDLALDLLAVLVDGEAVALDALVELVRRQSVVLGDRGDRRVDLLALGAELESFDDRGQQLALDQAVEGIAADLLHLALRGPSLAHALLDGARDLHHLGDEHDVVADLRRDPLDEGLGGSRRTGEQGKGGREDDEGADGEDNGEPGGEDGCAGRDRRGGEASATRPDREALRIRRLARPHRAETLRSDHAWIGAAPGPSLASPVRRGPVRRSVSPPRPPPAPRWRASTARWPLAPVRTPPPAPRIRRSRARGRGRPGRRGPWAADRAGK
jgi:hypothetical protein